MSDNDATTKPMLETLLERIDDLSRENAEFRKSTEEKIDTLSRENAEFRKSVETRLDDFGQRLDGFEYRLDNIEKQFSLSRVDVLDVKMEFRELRNQLKDLLPALK
jgi:septation ring formation regulator EzrA